MKKLTLILVLAILLGGGALTALSTPCYAQGYVYPPPPADPYSAPWVGPQTPWVYFNGDWFLNGILYYFFGPQYGWCPYYAYPTAYIVRPQRWYAPMWQTWYSGHPTYWNHFRQAYPYWRSHRVGQHYDQRFYEQHHHGHPGDWQKGFRGHPAGPPRPGGPGHKPPPVGHEPGPGHFTPPGGIKPGPLKPLPETGHGHVAPPPGPRPTHVTSPAGPKPAPGHVTPPAGPRPAPGHVAPPAGPRPGPAHVAPPAKPKPAPKPAPPAGGQKEGGHSAP
jgi:hypothetical protein